MLLHTHERIWLTRLIDAHVADTPAEDFRGNVEKLRDKIKPSPESILRESLEIIAEMGDPTLEDATNVARAGLSLARKVEHADD